jgi:hypothetical protein
MFDVWTRALASAVALGSLAGCSGVTSENGATLGGGPSVTGYVAANALYTLGYTDREQAPGTHRVRAKGTAGTPPSRLEKIALARAAEIGVEQNFKFFKPGPFTHTVACKDAQTMPHKGGKSLAVRSPVADVEVTYAKIQTDPTFLPSAETFAKLTGELATDVITADASAQAVGAIAAACVGQ